MNLRLVNSQVKFHLDEVLSQLTLDPNFLLLLDVYIYISNIWKMLLFRVTYNLSHFLLYNWEIEGLAQGPCLVDLEFKLPIFQRGAQHLNH